MKKLHPIIILEMCCDGPVEETYNRQVKCTNCHAEWYATIKKGVLVTEHECYNCGQKKLIPVR